MRDTEHRAMAEYESRLEMAATRIRELEARESELTVEQCLKELREMFPGKWIEIIVSSQPHVPRSYWIKVYGKRKQVEGTSTLEEAMAQVREWAESQDKESNRGRPS